MLADVYSEYSALLPFGPANLAERVNALISPLKLSTLEDGEVTVTQLANIWVAALDNIGNKDSRVGVRAAPHA